MSARNPKTGVNDQQEVFCQCYARTFSVSEGADEAGFSRRYAYELLEKPHIRERISAIQADMAESITITAQTVMREAAYLAFSDITEVLGVSLDDLPKLPHRVRKAIRRITQVDHYDKEGNRVRTRTVLEMHNKDDPLKLLAVATGASRQDRGDEPEAPWTGVEVRLIEGPKKSS